MASNGRGPRWSRCAALCCAAGLVVAFVEPVEALSKAAERRMTARFASQVRRCWLPPGGADGAKLKVDLRIRLGQDGALAAEPEVMRQPEHPLAAAFAKSAVKAVQMCAPYKLPAAHYAEWKDFTALFDAVPTK